MTSRTRRALRNAGRWLLDRIESYPIPIEDMLCAHVYGSIEPAENVMASVLARRTAKRQGF